MKGIDVSKWNGSIDWQAVARSGIGFAMIRAGTGAAKGGFTRDPCLHANLTGAADAGLAVGVYLYSYARSPEAALAEAAGLLAAIEPYRDRIRLPVCYDIEEDAQAALGKAACTALCAAFCGAVRAAGYRPMVYASAHWLQSLLDTASLDADIWLAQWSREKTYTGPHAMWQYTDSGSVPGIAGHVDLDIAYADYAALTPEPADPWARDARAAAQARGLLDGKRPRDPVTRQELSVVLQRAGLV